MNSKPGGRVVVWIGVLVFAVILLLVFIAKPVDRSAGDMVATGTSEADIAESQVPGASDRQAVNRPAAPENGG